jgi:type II secretory ATPase GspE/PulE/Tfp pilus assembly ATPase PilB-like protein
MTWRELEVGPSVAAAFEQVARRAYGLTLVCGPTGSGKTFTTRLLIESMARKAISDPASVPTDLEELCVLDAGDIRDDDLAQLACRLARQLPVVAALRSGESVCALQRLLEMGVDSTTLAQSDPIVITQRLCRRLCPACRRPQACTPSELAFLARGQHALLWLTQGKAFVSVGCEQCAGGFRGSVPVFDAFKAHLTEAGPREGERWCGMLNEAVIKVVAGLTTVAELERVMPGWALTGDDPRTG